MICARAIDGIHKLPAVINGPVYIATSDLSSHDCPDTSSAVIGLGGNSKDFIMVKS